VSLPRPRLRGARLELRPLTADDMPGVEAMLAEPEVLRWWHRPHTAEELLEDPAWAVLAVDVAGELAGIVAYSEQDDPMYRSAAVDISLARPYRGQGLGPEAIVVLVRWLHAERRHHRVTIDPATANDRAIRAYERVGFRPVGVMRRYERGADGSWNDGLLMDLLLPDEVQP